MCEFFQRLTISDWVNILQMSIAGVSAYLLYLTFKKQGENDERNIELAELEKRAKRAEYMPIIQADLSVFFPVDLRFAAARPDLSIDKLTEYKITLKVIKNPIQIIDMKTTKNFKDDIQFDFSHSNFDGKTLITPDTSVFITYRVNYLKVFGAKANEPSSAIHLLISKQLSNIRIQTTLFYSDIIGNKYSVDIVLLGDDTILDVRAVKILD